ncbi:CocE/NonD family hydrolase C-terminal non-catalytic domain-containing protein, partial [Xanthomonas perforans]
RAGPDLAQIGARVAQGDYDGAVQGFLPQAASRSPATDVAALNARGTAVLLGNAFNDGLFPPNQTIAFFNQLRGPKQLLLSQGDHATAELPGALGLPNEIYTATTRWFDRHLKQVRNGVDAEAPVRLSPRAGQWLDYPDWASVQQATTQLGLSAPAGLLSPTGGLTGGTSSGWQSRIATGVPTVADSGVVLVSGLLRGIGLPVSTSIPLVNRAGAAVWVGSPLTSTRRLTGSPSLRVTVVPSQSNVSLFAYLYRMDGLGVAQLITHAPYSLRNSTPGRAVTLDWPLQAAATEIPAGQRLVLVIDTRDARYTDASEGGGTVTFTSPVAAPSVLNVPLR